MLDSGSVVAFIAVTDLDRARLFYEQRLGLATKDLQFSGTADPRA
jgi:predicted enzyme related to lactoylglutathione lyase